MGEVNYIPYYLKVYEADSLYLVGEYKQSYEILDGLFKRYEPLNQQGLLEIETYIKAGFLTKNFNNIKPSFIRLIGDWGYDETSFNNKTDTAMLLAWTKFTPEGEKIAELKQKYIGKINWTLRDTIGAMHYADQLYRGKDRGKKVKREDSVDLVHIDLLKYLFKKYGYPDNRLVGDISIPGSVFNHISNNLNEKDYQYFRDELFKFLKHGSAVQHQITMFVDKREYDRNQRTVYGTFGTHESFGDRMIKFDTAEINKNRRLIGLPSVKYQQFKFEVLMSKYD